MSQIEEIYKVFYLYQSLSEPREIVNLIIESKHGKRFLSQDDKKYKKLVRETLENFCSEVDISQFFSVDIPQDYSEERTNSPKLNYSSVSSYDNDQTIPMTTVPHSSDDNSEEPSKTSSSSDKIDTKKRKFMECFPKNKGKIAAFSVAAVIATGIAASVFFGKNPDLLLGSVAKNLSLIIGVTVGLVLLISGAYKLAKHCEPKGYFDIREGGIEQPIGGKLC